MKKTVGWVALAYGISLSTYFGWWCLQDFKALEDAVRINSSSKIELRHRINVGFEGVWFMLSNMIAFGGAALVSSRERH